MSGTEVDSGSSNGGATGSAVRLPMVVTTVLATFCRTGGYVTKCSARYGFRFNEILMRGGPFLQFHLAPLRYELGNRHGVCSSLHMPQNIADYPPIARVL